MGIAKKQQAEHRSVSKETIRGTLTSIRKNMENARVLFELLENTDALYTTEPQFIKMALGGRNYNDVYDLDTLYQSFCEAYTIRLLEERVHPQKYLYLLFAIFGFLPNYRDLGVGERYEKFVKENPDMRFKNGAKAIAKLKWPDSSLQKIENEKIDEVATQLEKDISKNGERLGFVSAVIDELAKKFPEGLPEELPADFLKRIKLEPFSDKNPLQDETSEDDKIEHTGQVPNTPIEISDEGTVTNELVSEDSTPEKLIAMQSRFQTWRSILKTRKRIITALAVVSIISVIVVIIFVRHIAEPEDNNLPIGRLFIRSPDGAVVTEYNFTLDVGKGKIIEILGMPDDADTDDLQLQFYPDTDMIRAEKIDVGKPQEMPLLIKAQETRIGEVENLEDESKMNIITIVAIYEKLSPACMNVTVVPNSEEEFSKELSGNGGED